VILHAKKEKPAMDAVIKIFPPLTVRSNSTPFARQLLIIV